MSDRRDFFENLVYGGADYRRYTQQSPVMPDVWIRYGMHPDEQMELLMVPDWTYSTTDLARELKAQLEADRDNKNVRKFRPRGRKPRPSAVAYNQNVVVATLWFDELVRAVLPLSRWWLQSIAGIKGPEDEDKLADHLANPKQLVAGLTKAWDESEKPSWSADVTEPRSEPDPKGWVTADALWLARVAGLVAYLSTREGRDGLRKAGRTEQKQVACLEKMLTKRGVLAGALIELLQNLEPAQWEDTFPLYSVNRNRETSETLCDSVAAVKADAANRVFKVAGEGIRWAVIDSGIDARHVAFRKRDEEGNPNPEPFSKRTPRRRRRGAQVAPFRNETRVLATYNFVHIRQLLGTEPDEVDGLDRNKFPALKTAAMRNRLKQLLEESDSHMIDWERLEPFLEVRHEPGGVYRPPVNRHGTHVAGIIGADWRRSDEEADLPPPPPADDHDLVGICPQIELYDLRVLDDSGQGNEFAIMSALQFVRDLNNRKDFVAVHGVNLSFSIEHDVANYACGRTPVCEEAERLVGSGIVVVAAAGNSGRARYVTPSGVADDGFRTVSITDPGNAESAITVGATHRRDAHTYGVSYFSSRGPTGDGRRKPDLVAPGEKIRSTVPGDADAVLDGTSMAAPHVSGAAALIMARHAEFIGQPRRIKEILCKTATDLGRERYFQGAGLLDVLRALHSI